MNVVLDAAPVNIQRNMQSLSIGPVNILSSSFILHNVMDRIEFYNNAAII